MRARWSPFSDTRSRIITTAVLVVAASAMLVGTAAAHTQAGGRSQTYEIKVTNEVAVNSALNSSLTAWKQMVESDTKGEVKVDLYPAGQLLSDADAVSAIQQGTIQMNISTTGRMASVVPALKVFDFPYLFTSGPQLKYFWSRQLGKLLNKQLAARNVRGITIWPLTGRIVIATTKKVASYHDLAGLKIRTFSSDAQAAALKSLGAIGVTVQPSEIATAIATHVVDGIATGMAYWWQNYSQPLPYAIYTGMWQSPYAVWVNNDFWNSLPPKIRATLIADLTKAKIVGLKIVSSAEAVAARSGHVSALTVKDLKVWHKLTAKVPGSYASELGRDIVKAAADPKSR